MDSLGRLGGLTVGSEVSWPDPQMRKAVRTLKWVVVKILAPFWVPEIIGAVL